MTDDQDRYARHRLIDWWDQDRLRAARILVLGAGAIGNAVIELLALTGVGRIVIVDFDRVERSNLTRSALFRDEDIGHSKAETAARRARDLNPEIIVTALDCDLEFDVGLGIYRSMDVVISCLDSVGARLAANRACRRVGTHWLNGGIEATFAEVGLYSGREGACYQCSLPEGLWQRHAERFSCTGLRTETPPDRTPTTAVVAAITAGYLVNEALCLIHAKPDIVKEGLAFGQKLFLTTRPYGFYVLDMPFAADCLAHDRWEPIEMVAVGPPDLTAEELLMRVGGAHAEMELDFAHATTPPLRAQRNTEGSGGEIELDFDLLTRMRCVRCGAEEMVMQPMQTCAETLSHCVHCDSDTRRPEMVSRIAAGDEFADWPLARLGVPPYQILAVNEAGRRRYVQLTGQYD